MQFRILGLLVLTFSFTCFANGRSPAVEDFVGIEVEHPEAIPQGTEGLFNFEKDISRFDESKIHKAPETAVKKVTPSWQNEEGPAGATTLVTIALILGLPALSWFLVMNRLRQKAQIESASNIAVLARYRQEREEARKAQDEYKKVS